MNEVGQRLPSRFAAAGPRGFFARWKLILPVAVVLSAAVIVPLAWPRQAAPESLAYSELVAAMGAGRVASLEVGAGDAVRGRFVGSTALPGRHDFITVYPTGLAESLIERAEAAGVAIAFERPRNTERYRNTLMLVLQLMLFAGIGYFLYVQF
ncbi:MAG TPA: hypothetical protein VK936_05395, partial [Longimicrobiales bacterium]|nr:hypothetical protein [Longimicrobiales bacterium]